MGKGDEVLVSGRARKLYEDTGRKVLIVDRAGTWRWSEVWEEVPFILKKHEPGCIELLDAPKARPYIKEVVGGHIVYDFRHRAIPGTIIPVPCSTPVQPYIIIEPCIKGTVSANNKDWGKDNWRALHKELHPLTEVWQFKHNYTRTMVANLIQASSFREACYVLSKASLFIGTDGALHHAAAALGVPAIVIWGGYSSPAILGYDSQINLYPADPRSPCGKLSSCEHCRQCMKTITVQDVLTAAKGIICQEIKL